MTIKKKDGNVYTLQGPNKLVKNQENWDVKKLIFYNFSWEEIIYNKKNNNNIEKIKINNTETKFEKKQTYDEQKIEIQEEQKQQEEKLEKTTFELPFIKHKVLMHCLPAKIKTSVDPLYGESWISVQYQKKITFPCVLISNQDLSMEFWTSDPNEQITERSIVYPFLYEIYNESTNNYDKVPFDDRRWWKITNKEKKQMGWLFKTIPSDSNPDFSD